MESLRTETGPLHFVRLPSGRYHSAAESRAGGQGGQLLFVPPVDAASAISVSSDLINWTLLTNLPASLGPVYFTDGSATNFTHRFYRAQWEQ